MKIILRYIMLTMLVTMSAQVSTLKAKNIAIPKMYMFGFAASFNDSIVHFTEIQTLDSVWVDQKTEFLMSRDNYSYQLRDFLANKLQMPHRTCVVIYNKDRQKLEKQYLKMRRIYTTSKKKVKKKDRTDIQSHNEIHDIASTEFRFHTIDMSEPANE